MIDNYSILVHTGLPDPFAGQHCANIGRKFSDLSLRSQKEIIFSTPANITPQEKQFSNFQNTMCYVFSDFGYFCQNFNKCH